MRARHAQVIFLADGEDAESLQVRGAGLAAETGEGGGTADFAVRPSFGLDWRSREVQAPANELGAVGGGVADVAAAIKSVNEL